MAEVFNIDAYRSRELSKARQRVEFLERERARLESLLAHLLGLITPNTQTGLLLVDALAEALGLNPAAQGPPAPSRRRLIPANRMIDLLSGP